MMKITANVQQLTLCDDVVWRNINERR